MDKQTARFLSALNCRFYEEHASSFSDTRNTPWSGWAHCLDAISYTGTSSSPLPYLSVLDLACGNLRFEAFLTRMLPTTRFDFFAVDACDTLIPSTPAVNYQHLDVLSALLDGSCLHEQLVAPACDLSVSFGFMHHVPCRTHREELLLSLIRKTRPGGHTIVSLWQFANNENMRKKAQAAHSRALAELGQEKRRINHCIPSSDQFAPSLLVRTVRTVPTVPAVPTVPEDLPAHLEQNDFLLGWQNTPGAFRYCHSFSDVEVNQLAAVAEGSAHVVARFKADGRTNDLNAYLVFKRL